MLSHVTAKLIGRVAVRTAAVAVVTLVALGLLLSTLWRDRVQFGDVPIPAFPLRPVDQSVVTVTWFGVTTLLFDDGKTQILIDGFISRPSLLDTLARRPVDNDVVTINNFLNEYRVRRLAAIIPVHSHFDHAMDVGAIANRSSASILGSESTANIARGSGVPEDQIIVAGDGMEYGFGEFTVRLIESVHAPVGWLGSVPLPGTVDQPLGMPAPVTAFREGGSYAILIEHPQGTTLVHGSAGIRESALDALQVDAVMLGVGGLDGLGKDYMENYWLNTVTSTGATTVIPVHFDDFMQAFGTIEFPPRFLDDFLNTAGILQLLRDTWDTDTELYLPEFGAPMALYPRADPEA